MFKPRWKKEALLLLKGAKKFLHYKRDLLAPDRIDEIESRRADLKAAIKAKDLDAVKETSKQVRNTCEKSLTHYRQPDWLQENIEVFWVAIVVALGIRAFFLQPFRIPTGSMQPALNGIVATTMHHEEGWDKPWFGKRAAEFLLSGRSYENIVAKKDLTLVGIEDASFFLFSRTRLTFNDKSEVIIGSPINEVEGISTLKASVARVRRNQSIENENRDRKNKSKNPSLLPLIKPVRPDFEEGDPIFQGYLTSGDLVLVDKLSYHFRQPKRGESFVFDTRDIKTDGPATLSSQEGTHYIKRLVGIPGDTIQVKEPHILVNGVIAKEPTMVRVMDKHQDSKGDFFPGYRNISKDSYSPFRDPNHVATLEDKPAKGNNYREFYAFGDNSPKSLDSRYWGSVKQYNIVGPAFVSLWPFNSGHWGFIK